jgi:hypothetical protein
MSIARLLGAPAARTPAWQNVPAPIPAGWYWRITGAYLVGAGLNSFIPARVGDAVKIFLAKRSIRGSSYPAITSSFFVQSVFDSSAGILVFLFAITQGLRPQPPELPNLPAFEISFWAQHPRFLLFLLTVLGIGIVLTFAILARRAEEFWNRIKQGVVVRHRHPALPAHRCTGKASPGCASSPSGSSSRLSTSAAPSRT